MNNSIVPFEPVSKDLIYMQIADAIHNYIHANQLSPGDKLPAERMLAVQLKTSRNSVREALRVLENEGIIQVKTGKGAFITQPGTSDSIYMRLFKVNYIELLNIKTLLEQEAIRSIIHSPAPRQLDMLEQHLVTIEKLAANDTFSEVEDGKFHRQLLSMAANKTLAQMVESLIYVLSDYASVLEDAQHIWVTTIPYHRQLFNAIKENNFAKACEAHQKIFEIDMLVMNSIASEEFA